MEGESVVQEKANRGMDLSRMRKLVDANKKALRLKVKGNTSTVKSHGRRGKNAVIDERTTFRKKICWVSL